VNWAPALILCIFGPLTLIGAWCFLRDLWKHRNPMILDDPQPDSRQDIYRDWSDTQ
jgi:hypothetical protein